MATVRPSAGDESFAMRDDRAVVEEDVGVILGGEQCANVALQHEVGQHAALIVS